MAYASCLSEKKEMMSRPWGSALRARRWSSQKREILMRVLTHNLMLLASAQAFERA
jgi:hypothetical protein